MNASDPVPVWFAEAMQDICSKLESISSKLKGIDYDVDSLDSKLDAARFDSRALTRLVSGDRARSASRILSVEIFTTVPNGPYTIERDGTGLLITLFGPSSGRWVCVVLTAAHVVTATCGEPMVWLQHDGRQIGKIGSSARRWVHPEYLMSPNFDIGFIEFTPGEELSGFFGTRNGSFHQGQHVAALGTVAVDGRVMREMKRGSGRWLVDARSAPGSSGAPVFSDDAVFLGCVHGEGRHQGRRHSSPKRGLHSLSDSELPSQRVYVDAFKDAFEGESMFVDVTTCKRLMTVLESDPTVCPPSPTASAKLKVAMAEIVNPVTPDVAALEQLLRRHSAGAHPLTVLTSVLNLKTEEFRLWHFLLPIPVQAMSVNQLRDALVTIIGDDKGSASADELRTAVSQHVVTGRF